MARGFQPDLPRRSVIGGLLGGALGLAGLARGQAKGKGGKGGGGKGKGKGKRKDRKPTTCMKAAAVCHGSHCGMGDECCEMIDCDCRQGLVCNYTTSESGTCGCVPDEVMHNGRCGTKKDCIPAGGKRYFGDRLCCSGSEHSGGPNTIYGICDVGDLACLTDSDCNSGSCRGYMCYAPELDCSIYYNN